MLQAIFWILLILLISIAIGGPVSTTIGFTAFAAIMIFLSPSQFTHFGTTIYSNAISANNALVPLFVMMAEFITRGGIAEDIYYVLAKYMRKVRGGLATATILACTVFAALCGSSPATAATIGKVSLTQMTKRGYRPDFAIGTVAGGGTLGIMIPPSITLVMYGILTQTSIVKLLMAGILPGIMLSLLMCLSCMLRVHWNPSLIGETKAGAKVGQDDEESAPVAVEEYKTTFWQDLLLAGPAMALIAFIMICMYTGAATPTECAGIGAAVSFFMCLGRRRLNKKGFIASMLATCRTSSMMILMLSSALMLSFVIGRLGIATALATMCTTLNVHRWVIMILLFGLWYFLGTIMSATAMVTLTIPFIFPALMELGFDPIWLGVVSTLCVEVGMITPPVGNNLFILKQTTGLDIGTIIKGAFPYVIVLTIGLVILCAFPHIATFIPSLM